MSAGQYDIAVDQFATWSLPILWQDDAGAAVDLTGYSASMNVVDGAGSVVVSFTTTNGGITLGTTNGLITLQAPSTQTADLRAGAYRYDLLLTSPGGVKTRLLEGSWTLAQGVTPT